MNQYFSNALLPPMEKSDFRQTPVYWTLKNSPHFLKIICRFLSVKDIEDLEYTPNPQIFYAPYDPDDFEEVWCFVSQNQTQSLPRECSLSLSKEFEKAFIMKRTSVGKFVLHYNDSGKKSGILSGR